MRRIRHLQYVDYIVPVKQKAGRGFALSDCNVRLERTWHERHRKIPQAKVHAKYDSSLMDGIQVLAHLAKDPHVLQSTIDSSNIYRVADNGWTRQLISSVAFTINGNGFHTAYVSQSTLGLNELSGKETYLIEVRFLRVRRHYGASVWFNHLGCFDSINDLVQETQRLEIMKMDE